MKVLLTADTVGGVWDYAVTLARELIARDHDVLLAVIGETSARPTAALPPEIEVATGDFRLEWMRGAGHDNRAAAAWLNDLALQWGADVAHLNQMAYSAEPFAAPTVVVGHSDVLSWFNEVHGTAAPPAWNEYERSVTSGLRGATAVVTPTHYQAGLLFRNYGRRVDRVIANAATAPPGEPGFEREPSVLAAGRMWDEAKGAAILDAAAGLLEGDSATVRMFGPIAGPQGERFAPRHMQCPGALDRGELEGWMQRAAVFVAPSLYEPFGLAPLEAALNGCALVLSDIGSFRELWDGCAEFYEPRDPTSLARALEGLLRDPDRRVHLARSAGERARHRFDPAGFAEQYITLYQEVLGERSHADSNHPLAADRSANGAALR